MSYYNNIRILSEPLIELERTKPKFRRFKLPEMELRRRVNAWKVAVNESDGVSLYISVKGEGEIEVPKEIAVKIKTREIDIVNTNLQPGDRLEYIYSDRPERKIWTLKKLLWECLKESQYVEFEEIPIQHHSI